MSMQLFMDLQFVVSYFLGILDLLEAGMMKELTEGLLGSANRHNALIWAVLATEE